MMSLVDFYCIFCYSACEFDMIIIDKYITQVNTSFMVGWKGFLKSFKECKKIIHF